MARLSSFCAQSGCSDGNNPNGALLLAGNGLFYGTTLDGGNGNHGTIFQITASGTLTTLYTFCSLLACADGYWPYSAVIQASDGNFYGATNQGGTGYVGTIFSITPSGSFSTVYSFCSQGSPCMDGSNPYGPLIQASDGDLYGTTSGGAGNVFRLSLGLSRQK